MANLCMVFQLKPGSAIVASMQHCVVCPWHLLVTAAFSGDCTASRLELAHPKVSYLPLPLPHALVAWLPLPLGAFQQSRDET